MLRLDSEVSLVSNASRRLSVVALLSVLVILAVGCGRGQREDGSGPSPRASRRGRVKAAVPSGQARALAQGANSLGFSLYNALAPEQPDRNLFISPVSLQTALCMTYNGAAGKTAGEMGRMMGLGEQMVAQVNSAAAELLKSLAAPGEDAELLLANGLFCNKSTRFRKEFLEANKASYQAEIRALDFARPDAADTVNAWAKDKTRGLIPRIVNAGMLAGAEIVLANAVYFKGQWWTPFPADLTKNAPFHLPAKHTKTVPMMQRDDVTQHVVTKDFEAVRLPYKGDELRMVVLLPKKGTTPAALLKEMTADRWGKLMTKNWAGEGTLLLPRFKADCDENLNQALSSLGMKSAFVWPGADFSKMADRRSVPEGLYLSWVIQQCAVEVDEKGTVAAAVTHMGGAKGGMMAAPPVKRFRMVVDRPFVFAIEHVPTRAILFLGSISDPG